MMYMFNYCGLKVVVVGNVGLFVLDILVNDYDVIVLEFFSFQFEIILSLVLQVVIILNISDDYLDRYQIFENYV